jgi:hypothetical protein
MKRKPLLFLISAISLLGTLGFSACMTDGQTGGNEDTLRHGEYTKDNNKDNNEEPLQQDENTPQPDNEGELPPHLQGEMPVHPHDLQSELPNNPENLLGELPPFMHIIGGGKGQFLHGFEGKHRLMPEGTAPIAREHSEKDEDDTTPNDDEQDGENGEQTPTTPEEPPKCKHGKPPKCGAFHYEFWFELPAPFQPEVTDKAPENGEQPPEN